jgi:hypothetical protein
MNTINSTYPNSVRPKYIVETGSFALLNATYHSGASGFFHIYNPVGSSIKVFLKKLILRASATTALVAITAPRIGVTRYSYTGTVTATAVTAAKLDSAEGTPTALCVTAGMGTATMTTGATCASFIVPANMTAVGVATGSEQRLEFGVGEELILAAGEGVVINQMDTSTASDTRVIAMTIMWEETI